MTIEEILRLDEKEDKVEFKEAKNNFSFEGGNKTDYKKRRKCVLGYVVALANEKGGKLILGIKESKPKHVVVGSNFREGKEKELEQSIYNKLRIRVRAEVLFDSNKNRVLIIDIPSRPVGKIYTFEDIPLMRVGDQLERMSDEEYLKIVNEQEPDFSALFVDGLSISDLSKKAINNLKKAYSEKQKNPRFLSLSDEQILKDLSLLKEYKLNYAALVLLGTPEAIKKYLPQSSIRLEFRSKKGQITFDKRTIFEGGYFLIINELWETINSRNGFFSVQEGPYIFDIPYFNQEVIREAINNAVAHRDYKMNGEILVKQYSNHLEIINPGGLPKGVTLENLIKVVSTPRNRILSDVLSKSGSMERSGQGVDKIYYQCLSEAKGEPDYSRTDDYQVELHLKGIVQDKAFALFIKKIQSEKKIEERLSVHDIIVLEQVRNKTDKKKIDKAILEKLVREGHIEKIGNTRNQSFRLSKVYYELTNRRGEYTANTPLDPNQIGFMVASHFESFEKAKMGDFVQLFKGKLTRDQVKNIIYKLVKIGFLASEGKGRATKYLLDKQMEQGKQILSRAIELGMEQLVKSGEIEKIQKKEKK